LGNSVKKIGFDKTFLSSLHLQTAITP